MSSDKTDKADEIIENAQTALLREMNSFAYTIAHDLKAPLRAMNAFAEALDEDYSDVLDEQGRQYLSHITQGAQNMSAMIDDLMTYSRIGQGNVSFGIEDIGALVNSALEKLGDKIARSDANVHIAAPLPEAIVNGETFSTLVSHLVENSIKFAKPGIASEIRISGENKRGSFVFSVSDNGIGIDPELTDRIFKIFLRLEPNSGLDGTGIGLAAVQKIVQLHGGDIEVSTSPGEGATFRIRIPQE